MISFHCFMAYIFSDKKSLVILTFVSLFIVCPFSLTVFRFAFNFGFRKFEYSMLRYMYMCVMLCIYSFCSSLRFLDLWFMVFFFSSYYDLSTCPHSICLDELEFCCCRFFFVLRFWTNWLPQEKLRLYSLPKFFLLLVWEQQRFFSERRKILITI